MNNKNKRQKNLISCGKKKKLLSYMTNAHRVMHNDHVFFLF